MRKIISIITLTILFAGCEDRLNLDPHQAISTDQAFETIDDVVYALNGAIGAMRANTLYAGNVLIYPDIMADNLTRTMMSSTTYTNLYNWNCSSDENFVFQIYSTLYSVVYRMNMVIANVDKFIDQDATRDLGKHYKGEAIASRALMHYEAVRTFSKAYSQANDNDLGVPYVDNFNNDFPSRETVKVVYEKILADLEEAYNLMGHKVTDKNRINKNAVAALLAKVNMDMGNFDDVITFASEVINMEGLEERSQFNDIWKDQTRDGVIFYIGVENKDQTNPGYQFNQTGVGGTKSNYVCSYQLYNLYNNNDVRKNAYIVTTEYDGNTYNHIEKYRGREKDANGFYTEPELVDIKILRVAEQYLLRAEAKMLKSPAEEAGALADLNVLRSKRYANFTPGNETGQALLDAIYLERRLELAFENDRIHFLKRKGWDVDRTNHGPYANGEGPAPEKLHMDATSNYMLLPIPTREMEVNINMEQNEGYE